MAIVSAATTYVDLEKAKGTGFAAKAATTLAGGENVQWPVGEVEVKYKAESIRVTTNGKASGTEVATILKNGSTYIYDGSGYTGTQEYHADDPNNAWQVVTGAGNDTIHYGTTQSATLDGGAGNDTFAISAEGSTAYVTLGEGKDTVDLTGGTATFALQDYDAANDVIKVSDSLNPAAAINTVTSDGKIFVATAGTATINSTDGYYEAVLAADTAKQDVYFAGTAGTIMDASAKKTGVFMVGTTNDTSDTLVGGAGSDTIVAGKGDKVNGGAGNDKIYLAGTNTMVELSSDGGHDTLYKGAGVTGDATPTIYVNADTLKGVSLTSDATSKLKVKLGSAYIDANEILEGEKKDEKLTFVTAAGTTQKVRAILKDANANYTYNATDDDDVDTFYGTAKNTQVDFTAYDKGNLVVNLAGDERFEDAKKYNNITKVIGSTTCDSVLVGGTDNVTLTAGKGNVSTSLWGGAKGNDVLAGTDESKDTFFFGAGDGNDTIKSYAAASTDEVGDKDVLYTYGAATQVTFDGSTVSMAYSDGSKLTLGVTGTDANVGGAVVDYTVDGATFKRVVVGSTRLNDTFTYNSDVEIYYGAAGKTNTMQVRGSDDAKVYLDGRTGQQYKNVTRLDASTAAGILELGGSTAADVITGGTGSSSLWGGAGNVSDTLKGGSGENTFFYGLGEGNDVFVNVASTDKVMLYGINAADVTGATYSATKTTLTMSDGAKLTFNNLANGATFTLGDSKYTYNSSKKAFEKA